MDNVISGNGWYLEIWPELTQEVAQARTLAAYKAIGAQNQPNWGTLISSGWGQLLYNFLVSSGAKGDDTLNEPVYFIGRDDKNLSVFLVPVSTYYDPGKVKNVPKYREIHTGLVSPRPAVYPSPGSQPPSPIIRTPPPAPRTTTAGGVYVPPPPQAPPAGVGWTYELYGLLNGQAVPLNRVLQYARNTYSVRPGGRVLVGESPADGFGFGGSPGQWSTLLPGVSPSAYGQDPDRGIVGFDGRRAWPIPGTTLNQIFGYNWRQNIYP